MPNKIIPLDQPPPIEPKPFFFEDWETEDRAVHQLELLMLEHKQWQRNSSEFAKPHLERISYTISVVWFILTGQPMLEDTMEEIDAFLQGD